MNKTLLLRSVGPEQSWGSKSYFDFRDTDSCPTKSGILGLAACALGRKRKDDISDLQKLKFGVRIDHPGERMTDFQTTEMEGYCSNVSHRVYLADAYFLVGLYGDEEFLEELEYALKHPVYHLYLGRKSCPPGLPVCIGIRDADLYDALYDEPWLLPDWRQEELFKNHNHIYKNMIPSVSLRIIMDDENSTILKRDFPVSFSSTKREYVYRTISEMPPKIFYAQTEGVPDILPATQHDVFSIL